METSFKPVNMDTSVQNPNNLNGDFSYANRNNGDDSSVNVLQIFLIGIAGVMCLVAIGIFVWSKSLSSSIASDKAQLEKTQDELSNTQMNGNRSFTSKLHAVKILIDTHPFITNIFEVLQNSTESGVYYNKFDTHKDSSSDNYILEVSGVSPNYTTLIQQIDVLKKDKTFLSYFPNTEIGDFKPNDKGSINFTIKIKSQISGIKERLPIDVVNDLSKGRTEANNIPLVENNTATTSVDTSFTDQVPATATPKIVTTPPKTKTKSAVTKPKSNPVSNPAPVNNPVTTPVGQTGSSPTIQPLAD